MRRFLAAASVVLFTASLAPACINDREVERHEREFKSQYRLGAPAQPSPEAAPAPVGGWAMWGGAAFLTGAVVVSVRSTRRE